MKRLIIINFIFLSFVSLYSQNKCDLTFTVKNYYYCNTGVYNVEVKLYNCFQPTIIQTQYTDINGLVIFTGLPEGCYDIVAWYGPNCQQGVYYNYQHNCPPPADNYICLNEPACDNNFNIPSYNSLSQNYPNPFNPSTEIKFSVIKTGVNVKIAVFDFQGKLVDVIYNTTASAFTGNVVFNASGLSSGIYFYTIDVTDPENSSGSVFSETKKMILIK